MLIRTERTEVHITGWSMFWLFAILYIMIEAVQFHQGYDTFFWRHLTTEEKQLQEQAIEGCKND